MMFTKIANGNEELYNKLFTRYRYRAATIIAKWVGHMLHLTLTLTIGLRGGVTRVGNLVPAGLALPRRSAIAVVVSCRV